VRDRAGTSAERTDEVKQTKAKRVPMVSVKAAMWQKLIVIALIDALGKALLTIVDLLKDQPPPPPPAPPTHASSTPSTSHLN
jgi:hypothetical protein